MRRVRSRRRPNSSEATPYRGTQIAGGDGSRRKPMRKAFVHVIALGTLAFIATPVLAENVDISGTHSAQEIKTTCKKVGGSFSGVDKDLGSYGCHKGGGIVSCTKDGKCTGCTNCTGNSKQAAGGTNDKRTVGGILANAPLKNVQPLTAQKTTRSPATGST